MRHNRRRHPIPSWLEPLVDELFDIIEALEDQVAECCQSPSDPAVSARIGVLLDPSKGISMASTFTVDEITGKTASIEWVDDKGDLDAAAPAGATISGWASDTPAVLTIDPNTAILTGITDGTATITAIVTLADGSLFPVTADVVTLTPGAAVAGIIQIA